MLSWESIIFYLWAIHKETVIFQETDQSQTLSIF